jgi:hypothetical protein
MKKELALAVINNVKSVMGQVIKIVPIAMKVYYFL